MSFCTACGSATGDDLFCTRCGHPTARAASGREVVESPGTWLGAAPAPDPVSPPTPPVVQGLARLRQLPTEVAVISGLMALGGVVLLVATLTMLPPTFALLTSGSGLWVLGLVVMSGLVMLAGLSVGMVVLGWRLTAGDRVARGLSYVLLGAVVAAVLVGADFRLPYVLVLLGSLAAAAMLAFAPNVNLYFRGSPWRSHEPVSIVIARTLLVWWGFAAVVTGASWVPLAGLHVGAALVGLVLVGLGIGALVVNEAIARGDSRARLVVTVAAGVYAVLPFLAGQWRSAIVPVSLAAGLVVFLWATADARSHFATPTRGDVTAQR